MIVVVPKKIARKYIALLSYNKIDKILLRFHMDSRSVNSL